MKHDRLTQRFAFIETRLLWNEGLTASDLGNAFGIARQNAQAVIEAYREQHPENLCYEARLKRHVRTEDFKPRYISSDAYLFLDYQRGMALAGYFHAVEDWADSPFCDADRSLRPHLDNTTLGVILAALRQHRTINVLYLTKTRTSRRILSPHHLVYADNRYHLRAFCHTKKTGLDFVPSRIVEAEFSETAWVSEAFDKDWQDMETLVFSLNPEAPEEARASLRQAYRLQQSDSLTLSVRKALAKYAIRRMTRLDAELKIPLWLCHRAEAIAPSSLPMHPAD